MVVDDVEQHEHSAIVGRIDQVTQVLTCAEARIDIEIILDAVAVICIQVGTLPPYGPYPKRGDSEVLKITEFASNSIDLAVLEICTRGHPVTFARSMKLIRLRPVEHRPRGFESVTEAVRKEEIEDLIAPVHRTRKDASSRLGIGVRKAARKLRFDRNRHGYSFSHGGIDRPFQAPASTAGWSAVGAFHPSDSKFVVLVPLLFSVILHNAVLEMLSPSGDRFFVRPI